MSTARQGFYQELSNKITGLILLVSFVPMVLTAGILYFQFSQHYTAKTQDHISEMVARHAESIDTFLGERLGNIRYMAEHFATWNGTPKSFLKEHLVMLKNEYGGVFTDLGLVDLSGRQQAYEGPFKLDAADYSQAQWFQEARKRAFYISDVFIGLRGHPHFIISVKVAQGPSTYLIRATVNFQAFNQLVDDIQVGQTGKVFILNSQRQLQTGSLPSDSSLLSLNLPMERSNYESAQTIFLETEDETGKEVLCVTTMFKQVDWILVYGQEKDDAYVDFLNVRHLTLAIFLLGSLAIMTVSVRLPRRIVTLISSADEKSEAMNRQVVESGKLASIGELAAGIAHEINNPVAIMVEEAGWMEDLMADQDPGAVKEADEFKRALLQIRTQGKRCKEITQKLLSFARKTDSTQDDVQINEIALEMVSLTGQMAKYSNIQVVTELDPQVPQVRVSPSELQQVILNLLNNAIDAMHKKGGEVKIKTAVETEPQPQVVMSITDQGTGIPKEMLSRIFDPFFTTKPVGKGTGLGLSICYGLIEKMGGRIEVESQVGSGTTFTIRLPLTSPEPH